MKNKKALILLAAAAVILVGVTIFAVVGGGSGDPDGPLNETEAKKVVLDDLNIKERDADSIHAHTTEADDIPCYIVYVTCNGENWEYLVNGLTGEILDKEQNDSGHSH